MNNYIGITTLMCFIVLAGTSCKKFVMVEPPNSQLTTETVFNDSINASRAINGIYMSMIEPTLGVGSGAVTLYPGLSADELIAPPDNPAAYEFFNNKILSINESNYGLWLGAYELIYKANACMEGITNSANIAEHAKNSLVAEARALRAFLYFYLTNLYGNVPLLTNTDYNVNRRAIGSSPAAVYTLIKEDLQFAKQHLGKSAGQQGKVSYYTVTALLARVYLYQQQYEQARQEASEVIESGLFELETNLTDVFIAGSKETIWALIPVYPGRETWEGFSFAPGAPDAVPSYLITDTLLSCFEADDQRKEQWIGINEIDGAKYHYPFKYKNAESGVGTTEHYTMLRLAEQYLIRAEAATQLGDFATAIADVNQLRRRAGLTELSGGDKHATLNAIAKERQTELFCEWGNRWFDLKRTGKADEILSKIKPGWSGFAKLYPIPQLELRADPNLIQNPGY